MSFYGCFSCANVLVSDDFHMNRNKVVFIFVQGEFKAPERAERGRVDPINTL